MKSAVLGGSHAPLEATHPRPKIQAAQTQLDGLKKKRKVDLKFMDNKAGI